MYNKNIPSRNWSHDFHGGAQEASPQAPPFILHNYLHYHRRHLTLRRPCHCHHLFYHLPPPPSLSKNWPSKFPAYVHQALQNISQKSNLVAFFIDFFCNAAYQVSSILGIPNYFFTTCASALCLSCIFELAMKPLQKNIKDLHDYIQIPGIPPVFSQDMPKVMLDRESKIYKLMLETAIQKGKSSGILVNSFAALESRAVKALSNGLCIPNEKSPPVYCVGPLIASNDGDTESVEHECLSWLNLQPSKSVVFLCFEAGLENRGHRFLWVVRNPPFEDETKATAQPDLDALLPQGFLERTKDKGLVVKS